MGSKQETEVERLLLENYETYYRLAYSYVRQEQDALDIVQESAYKAIRDCKTVRNPDYLATWVYRIVINTALDTVRKRKREELSDTLPEAVWEDSYGDVDLRGVLERLDDRSRTVVILRYFEDMKLEDGKTYQVAISGISEKLASETEVTDSGIVGMDAAKEFFGQFETLSEADAEWK